MYFSVFLYISFLPMSSNSLIFSSALSNMPCKAIQLIFHFRYCIFQSEKILSKMLIFDVMPVSFKF